MLEEPCELELATWLDMDTEWVEVDETRLDVDPGWLEEVDGLWLEELEAGLLKELTETVPPCELDVDQRLELDVVWLETV